jgi:hypothetical protein
MASMYRALLICSDDDCTEVFEAYGSLEELDTLACDCGCALQVIGWPEEAGHRGELELIPIG